MDSFFFFLLRPTHPWGWQNALAVPTALRLHFAFFCPCRASPSQNCCPTQSCISGICAWAVECWADFSLDSRQNMKKTIFHSSSCNSACKKKGTFCALSGTEEARCWKWASHKTLWHESKCTIEYNRLFAARPQAEPLIYVASSYICM